MDYELLIARRYAQAFLDVFTFSSHHLAQIKDTIDFLDQHAQVLSLLKVPLLDARIKMQALENYLIDRFKLPESFRKLIVLLVTHKRSFLIVKVLQQIEILFKEQQGIETFSIASSAPLEETDLEKVKAFLVDQTHHTIICVPEQNTDLIAGIRMQSDERIWEYSIRKQLHALRAHLTD